MLLIKNYQKKFFSTLPTNLQKSRLFLYNNYCYIYLYIYLYFNIYLVKFATKQLYYYQILVFNLTKYIIYFVEK